MMDDLKKAEHLARRRAQYASDPQERDKRKAAAQRWRLANPDLKREANRRWNANNQERAAVHKRRWKEANLDKVRQGERSRYLANREQQISRQRLKKTGWSEEAFARAWDQQEGRCAICATDLTAIAARHVHADHCHETHSPRGILCHWCNTGLGVFRDDAERLRAAINYLELHREG